MGSSIKRVLFKTLGTKKYLRLLQKGFFFSYHQGWLKGKKEYEYHYFVENLIRKGDTVVDIGANLGYYSKLFSAWVGNTGKVYSVEPISLYNEVFLAETKKCKNITLLPYALGAEEKEVELVTSTQSGYLRTGLPHIYTEERDGSLEEQEFRFKAQMRIPDQLFKDITSIDYLKCDVEGFEYIVLSNMHETIDRCKPTIQIELWGQNEVSVLEFMTERDYLPYKLNETTNANNKTEYKLSSEVEVLKQSGDYIFIHRDNKKYSDFIQ